MVSFIPFYYWMGVCILYTIVFLGVHRKDFYAIDRMKKSDLNWEPISETDKLKALA